LHFIEIRASDPVRMPFVLLGLPALIIERI